MWRRPSRSLKRTVTALIRFSSVRYLRRSSWILCAATRFFRCSLAFKFRDSNSSYESERKLRSSFDMVLLIVFWARRSFFTGSVGWRTTQQGIVEARRGPIKKANDCYTVFLWDFHRATDHWPRVDSIIEAAASK